MILRMLAAVALVATVGCERFTGAKSEAPEAQLAAPALSCEDGMFELLAMAEDASGTRTELQQKAHGVCQCLSATLTPGDYDFVEGFASFQVGAMREFRQFEARMSDLRTPEDETRLKADLRERGRALMRELEQTGWREVVQSLREHEADPENEFVYDPRTIVFLRMFLYLASLNPPIESEERINERTSAINVALGMHSGVRCPGIGFEEGLLWVG